LKSSSLLSYYQKGEKKPSAIVMLHGFCEDKSIWKDLQDRLSENYNTISIDLPGFGNNKENQTWSTIADFAKEVHRLVNSLQISQCVMVGHSLGGYVTLAFAELFPALMKGIVMFHSTALADSPQKTENRNKAIEFVTNNGTKDFVKNLIPTLFNQQNKHVYKQHIEDLIYKASSIEPQSIINAIKAMRDRTAKIDLLKHMACPVLYIVGKEDGAIPFEDSLLQSTLAKQAFACYLSNCGHMGMIEQSQVTSNAVEYFSSNCI
jgi:pimeloyl-ACP methyl ester carboxylesterase